jgi:hypothetical protein
VGNWDYLMSTFGRARADWVETDANNGPVVVLSAARPDQAVIFPYAHLEKPVGRWNHGGLCPSDPVFRERIFAEALHRLTKLQINLVRDGHHPK